MAKELKVYIWDCPGADGGAVMVAAYDARQGRRMVESQVSGVTGAHQAIKERPRVINYPAVLQA